MARFWSGLSVGAFALFMTLPMVAQDAAIAPQAPPNAIPEGTRFLIRLNDRLDTRKLEPGKHFKAKLAEDLVAGNGAVIPRGKTIKGHVSSVEQGLHARMLLSFDEIDTDHGSMPLIATVTGAPGEHSVKTPDEEGDLQRKGMSKERAIEAAAVGAGIGAVAGAVGGGGKGAGIGAGVGAGVGAAAGILSDHDLRLEKGTVLEVRLDHPLQIPGR
jgi:hypothetical protein